MNLLGLFGLFTIFTILYPSSVFARELNSKEIELESKAQLLKQLNEEYVSRFDIKDLPLSKYLSFVILKNGCAPFYQTIEEIRLEDESFPDKSAQLDQQYHLCHKSNMALKEFNPDDVDSSETLQRLSNEH